MPFHLITGRAHAGKSGVLARYVAEAIEAGQQPVMLLPTQADVRRARLEMAEKHTVGVSVTTFDAWLEAAWALHGDGRRFVGDLTRDVLVGRACANTPVVAAGQSASTPGFQKMVARVAARLPAAPRVAADVIAGEIGMIVAEYYRLLEGEDLVEPAQAATALARRLPPITGPVIANRFVDLSGPQESLLAALSSQTLVVLALVWEQGFAATEALDALVLRVREIADHHEHVSNPAPVDELTELEALLYSRLARDRAALMPAKRPMVELGLAAGRDAEIHLVAARVAELVEDGTPADRIAIVFRDLRNRAGRVKAALERRGIPASLDGLVPLHDTPYGKAFRALVEVVLGRAGREALYAFLSSPFSAADGSAVIEADREWRKRRVEDPAELLRAAGRFGPAAASSIQLASELGPIGVNHKTGNKWKLLADQMLAAAVTVRPSSEDRLLDSAAHRAVLDAIQGALEMSSGELSTPELLTVIEGASVSVTTGDRPGRVQITDVSRLRSRRYDAVLVGGLTAGEFSSERREPLVARYARALGGHGGTDESLSERMLFYLLATRARTKLVLVRQSTDEAGQPVRASVFWDEVVDLYRNPLEQDFDSISPCLPVIRVGTTDLAEVMPSMVPNRATERQRLAGARLKSYRRLHVATGESLADHLAQADTYSVTELESYLQCPYKWFYGRSVKPREIDTDLGARELGSFAHGLLNQFYIRFQEQTDEQRVTEHNLDAALAIFEEVADEAERQVRPRDESSLAERLDIGTARRRVAETIAADATFLPGYRPVAHELRFGFDGTPAVELAEVRLRGSIDRVDVGDAGAVVIDYKSGSSQAISWAKFEGEGCLQPPIYAIVAARMLEAPVAGGVYRPLGGNKVRGFWRADLSVPLEGGPRIEDRVDEEGAALVLESAERRLREAVDRMRDGDIAPRPLSPKACAHCGVNMFCPEVVS